MIKEVRIIEIFYTRYKMARCECFCGKIFSTHLSSIKNKHTKSCGCLNRIRAIDGIASGKRKIPTRKTHGMTNTLEFKTWAGMISRCENPKNASYYRYGGRGIRVCSEWHSFENFYKDMGKKPGREYSLDRINCDGDYEPSNCRWATSKEQQNNTSKTLKLNINGELLTISEISDRFRVSRIRIKNYFYYNNKNVEKLITYLHNQSDNLKV